MNLILKIHVKDNVGTCLRQIEANEVLNLAGISLKATEENPQYHKIALEDIPMHAPILKYGQIIGLAAEEIRAGAYVRLIILKAPEAVATKRGAFNMDIMGYKRENGTFGIRNHLLVIPASVCAVKWQIVLRRKWGSFTATSARMLSNGF